jgi:hypothetical protein
MEKQGKCGNFICANFGKTFTTDEDKFVCPKCDRPLISIDSTIEDSPSFGQWIKDHKLSLIIAITVLVAGIVIVLYFALGGDNVSPMEKIIVE